MRVVRTRSIQPDSSPGIVVAAIILLILIALDCLVWWTLLLDVALVPPLVNWLLVGRTHTKEITIERDL